MENVKNDDLEKLATRAEVEDKPAAGEPGGNDQAGEHLPADVEKMRYENAGKRAEQLLGLLEMAIKKKDARLSLPESAYAEAAPRLAPLLLKHNLDEFGLPDWLKPYQEEISALVFFVGIGAGVGMQLYALRAEDQAAAQSAADAGQPMQPQQEKKRGMYAWASDDEGQS